MKRKTREQRRREKYTEILFGAVFGILAVLILAFAYINEADAESEEYQLAQQRKAADKLPQTVVELRSLAGDEWNEQDPQESEKIEAAILAKEDKRYPLTDEEFDLVCKTVMAEAGGETYEGQMAVAQCILNGCERNGCRPAVLIDGQYTTPADTYSEDVWCAVTGVFYEWQTATGENICYFYAPALCEGEWHETQRFVFEIGGHRFFAPEE